MAFDTKKWLIDDMGFTSAEADTQLALWEPRASKLEGGYLRQSDYSRQMNEGQKKLADAQAALDTSNQKLNAEMAEWASLTAAEKAEATTLRDKIEATEKKNFDLTQKLTRLATEQGVDPKTLLGDSVVPQTPTPPPAPAVNLSGYVKAEQVGAVANMMLDLGAELPMLAQEHFELTGERLDTRAFVAKYKESLTSKNPLSPSALWESTYDIGAKRTTRDTAAREKEITAAEQRGREAALSEASLPNSHPIAGRHSPVFKTTNVAQGSKLERPQPSQRLVGAASALATGKYRKSA